MRLFRQSVVLSALATSTIITSFLYQWYTFAVIGPGRQTDALYAAIVIPQLVYAIVNGSLVYVLLPLLAVLENEPARRETWNILQYVAMISGSLAVLLLISAPIWSHVLFPGFDKSTEKLTASLGGVFLLFLFIEGLNAVLRCFYQSRERFVWPELTSALGAGISMVLAFWAVPRFGVVGAAWSYIARSAVDFFLLVPVMSPYTGLNWASPVAKEAWRRIRPILLGASYYRTDLIVDRFLSSMAAPGSLSMLSLARQIQHAAARVLNKAVAAPMVPLLANQAEEKNWPAFEQTYKRRLRWLVMITLSAFLVLVTLGGPILSVVFLRRNITQADVNLLWWLMVLLVGVMLGDPLTQILWNSFYAKGNTATPTKIGVFSYTVGIILRVIGFRFWGVAGIAAGTSMYYCANVLLLGVTLKRECRAEAREAYVGES